MGMLHSETFNVLGDINKKWNFVYKNHVGTECNRLIFIGYMIWYLDVISFDLYRIVSSSF